MANPLWRDRLRQELDRQRLPSEYVSRLVDELAEHAADLFMEDLSMDAAKNVESRLGTPEQLAAIAKAEFSRRTFAGRYPLLIFVLGPIFAVVTALIGCGIGVLATCWFIDVVTAGSLDANDLLHAPPSMFEIGLMHALNTIVRFVPFALSAWCFVRLGRRSGLRAWSIVACGIVAASAICFTSDVSQRTADGMGAWMMAVGWRIGFAEIVQAAVPLAIGACMLWRWPNRQWKVTAIQ